ncbi:MAG: YtxH domain-containing protein [Chloroflexi bacterium]|nr:YtxH domain-containing protein [Chloroflexota bacterium]
MEQQKGVGTEFVFGLFVGALLGASLAIVFAPQSGEATREMIRKKSKEMQDKAMDMLEELKDEVDDLVVKVQDAFEDTTKQVKTKMTEVKEKVVQKMAEKKEEGKPLPVE